MKCPWSVEEELREYVHKLPNVSANCRLTLEEELTLLKSCWSVSRTNLVPALQNRLAYVTGVNALPGLKDDKTVTVKLIARFPIVENFDDGPDTSIITDPKNQMISAKVFGAAYSRPEKVNFVNYDRHHCETFFTAIFVTGSRIWWNKGT